MTQFLDTPIDKSLSTTNTWTDIDLSGDIPASATGAIFRVSNSYGLGRNYGFRKNGSGDDRYKDITAYGQQYAIIGLDANRICEGRIESTAVDFFLIGYTEVDATFFTNAIDKSIATLSTWTDIDLSSDIPAGSVAAIYELTNTSTSYREVGLRKNGSTDNRHSDMIPTSHSFMIVGVDANRKCEGYIETSHVGFYLLGYLTMGQAETNAHDKSLGSAGTYIDIDESGNAPSGATGVFGELQMTAAYKFAARKNGTSFDYYEDCGLHDSLMAGLDANRKWEGKIENTDVDFYTLGYFSAGFIPVTKNSSVGLTIMSRKTKASSIGINIVTRHTKASSIGLRVVSQKTKASSIGLRVVSQKTKASSASLSVSAESEKISSGGLRIVTRFTKESSAGLSIYGGAIKVSSGGLAISEKKTKESSAEISISESKIKASSAGMRIINQTLKASSASLTVKASYIKESSAGMFIITRQLKPSSAGLSILGKNALISSAGVTIFEPVLKKGLFYGKLGDTILEAIEPESFRISEEINRIPSYEFEVANSEVNRAVIAANPTALLKIYWQHHGIENHIFTGIINADGIEYVSLTNIRITGFASYAKLGWSLYKHLDLEDAEPVNTVFEYHGVYTDYTTQANNATINDVTVSFGDVDHCLYIGEANPFWGLQVKYSTQGKKNLEQIQGASVDLVIANGTSSKTEEITNTHPVGNMLLNALYLNTPQLSTPNKTIKLELLTSDNDVIFSTGNLDASSAKNYAFHQNQRALMGITKIKVTADGNVASDKTITVKFRGLQRRETEVVVEYSKGSGIWAELNVLDETYAFTEDPGTYDFIIAHPPSDWERNTVDGVSKFWIRWRVVSGSYTTSPKLDQIHTVNVDIYRVFYLATSARAILLDVLSDTEYTMDAIDVCPEDEINIFAEYESPLRVIAAIPAALTWTDTDSSKKSYQWWIDEAKKVHMKKKRGTTHPDDITSDLTIFNNLLDYFNVSNRLIGFAKRDGLSQIRAIVENKASQTTHALREFAVPKTELGKYITLKESLEKDIAISKDPMQRLKGSVTTEFWGLRGYEVGDTITLHQGEWVVEEGEFQIVKVDKGPILTQLNLGISREHLEGLKSNLKRAFDINNVQMHGSTSLLTAGPETSNYERKSDGEVFSSKLKIEIPSEVVKTHKVLLSWTIGPYRASVNEQTGEGVGHDHGGFGGAGGATGGGFAGAGGAFTPDVLDGGDFIPAMLSEAHQHDVSDTLTIDYGEIIINSVGNEGVIEGLNHRHSGGSTGYSNDNAYAIDELFGGTACEDGWCINNSEGKYFATEDHYHQNSNTGYTSPNAYIEYHPIYVVFTIHPYVLQTASLAEDPAHLHDGVYEPVHGHNGVTEPAHGDHTIPAEPAHEDHVIITEPGGAVDIDYGIFEIPAGTVLELLINGEIVGQYTGDQEEIRIDGYLANSGNTVEIQPIAAETNKKGSATIWSTGILFYEPKKF